jgi:hypothetical protein
VSSADYSSSSNDGSRVHLLLCVMERYPTLPSSIIPPYRSTSFIFDASLFIRLLHRIHIFMLYHRCCCFFSFSNESTSSTTNYHLLPSLLLPYQVPYPMSHEPFAPSLLVAMDASSARKMSAARILRPPTRSLSSTFMKKPPSGKIWKCSLNPLASYCALT